jgi:hypothetical protein
MKQPMRAMAGFCLSLLAQSVAPPSLAQSEAPQFDGPPALRLMLCSKVGDGPARLKCFDEALAALKAPAPPAPPAAGAVELWEVSESKSPVDDSPQVVAGLLAEKGAGGMIFRCRERRIEGQYMPERFINTRDSVRGLFRLNGDKPVEVRWSGSTNGRSAFFNNAASFLRSLPDDGKLFMRAYDFQGAAHDATFNLGKVSEARTRVFAACAAAATPPAAKAKTQ